MTYAVETRDLTRIFAGKKKRRFRRKAGSNGSEDSLGPVTALDGVSLGIKEGDKVRVAVKAVNVLLIKD